MDRLKVISDIHRVAENVLDQLEETDYDYSEVTIPILVQAIIIAAGSDSGLLEEAADFLADGGA